MATELRVLILEDRADDAELLAAELRRSGYAPDWTRVDTREDFVAALAEGPDIVISDYSLPTMTAPDALRLLQDVAPGIPVIVVSGVMDEETCVTALRLGAVDYLLKDRLTRLGTAVEHALAGRRIAQDAEKARQQRSEAVGMLRAMVEHMPAAVHVRAPDGRLLFSNSMYNELAGALPAGAMPAGPDAGAIPDHAVETEVTLPVRGQDRTYLSVRYPVTIEGRAWAVGNLLVDITAQKHVEQRLRELDRMKTDFIATASHELRTPLTSISGYAEMLGDELGSAPADMQRSMLDVIVRNSQRLLVLTNDLMVLSKIDSGALILQYQPVDLADVLGSTLEVLRPQVTGSGVTIRTDVAAGLPSVPGDRGQLERVLLNLVGNALKFSERGGTVTVSVSASADDEEVVVKVADTGIGVPPEDLPKLFTRFYRSTEARKRAIQGTGLGLAVTAGIVERHGGTIAAESVVGEGTTMTVTLPVRQAAAAAGEALPELARG